MARRIGGGAPSRLPNASRSESRSNAARPVRSAPHKLGRAVALAERFAFGESLSTAWLRGYPSPSISFMALWM
jgi:hypothetical protein